MERLPGKLCEAKMIANYKNVCLSKDDKQGEKIPQVSRKKTKTTFKIDLILWNSNLLNLTLNSLSLENCRINKKIAFLTINDLPPSLTDHL